jgi:hypothetical protein
MICFRSKTVQPPGFFKQCNAIMPPFKLLPRSLPMFEMHQELFDQHLSPARRCMENSPAEQPSMRRTIFRFDFVGFFMMALRW